ncbi:MAG: nitroreductase family protein [Spirochaetota bacterium]
MFLSLAQQRRSCRSFLKKPVESEKIDSLVEAALRSPSSRGRNPWSFIVVTDPEMLEKLSRARPSGSAFLKEAPLGIVVLAESQKSDVWVEDCSIASIYIWLEAESLGLGGCWIQIRSRNHNGSQTAEEYVRGTLNIPSRFSVESIIALGYPDKKPSPHRKEELEYDKVSVNVYGKPYPSNSGL